MGKRLSNIKREVDESAYDFLEYLKYHVDDEVYIFLLKLSKKTNLYVFSGVIRNFFLKIPEIRDLDIVIEQDVDIRDLFDKDFTIRTNSFGGYKINIGNLNIDLWSLKKTWAIQYQKRFDFGIEELYQFIPSTAFFNFSAILYSFNEKKFYYRNSFLSFLSNKKINYVYKPNANYPLCVVNSLYYADKYNLKIADKLKRFLIDLSKTKLNYLDIQLKHFGKILYTEKDIKERISNFDLEKRHISNDFMENLEEVFTRLGLTKDNGLFITKDNIWKTETVFPNRVKRLIERELKPDAFFCFDNKPLILFFENPLNKYELHKVIWNFNECPIIISIENNIVEIYNGFDFDLKSELLNRIGKEEKLTDFTYFELVTGKTWEQYSKHLNYKNRVDYHLLQNIKSARKILVERHHLDSKIANAIIGKAIFVRYLIDRKVKIKFDNKLRTWSNEEFCSLFDNSTVTKNFFEYLEDSKRGFNGNLFPLTPEEYSKISSKDFGVVKNLLLGKENIETGQTSLFNFYDFSIIPIEFISNVYELFIGQDNQKKEGAYYTPLFLVDYILKETVENYLSKKEKISAKKYSNKLENTSYSYCRVLDPACGSGIFLVETLRKIIEKFIKDTGIEINSSEFKDAIINLAKENIYGIDKDASAVQVAIFSIYLTLLDYLEPPSIENFKFPLLYNTNFFEADFFDEEATFNTQLEKTSFQFILGNPPWKGNGMDIIGNTYLKNRKRKEKNLAKKHEIAINNNEIAEGFVLRVSDFCNDKTQVSLIIRSSSLYNLGYSENSAFRQYWTDEYLIDRIFELAPVRHEIFEKSNKPAIAPAVVVFYRYANGKNTNSNIVEHIALKQSRFFSLFKIFTINRSDYKHIEQKKFKDYDWIWKVLVYGSYLDFNFVKRLKEEFPTIKKITDNKEKFIVSTGFHSRTEPLEIPKNTSEIRNIPFIKTRAVDSFFIDYDSLDTLEEEKIDLTKDPRIYKAPMLLSRKGLDMNSLSTKCSISKRDIVFKDGITSIKDLRGDNTKAIESIASILSSELFAYYAINTFVSVGIEREQTQNYNKLSLPFLELELSKNIKNIEDSLQNICFEKIKYPHDYIAISEYESKIKSEREYINKAIYDKLNLSEVELSLIEFSSEINRTLIIGDSAKKNKLFSPLKYEDEQLKIYASMFVEKFKKLNTNEKKFIVKIWHTKQIVGMLFKMIPTSEYTDDIIWENKQENDLDILSFLTKISSKKITDMLFIQKDVRGFEKDFFYIFKPNEKRLWHKAIAYLDINEFADAILKEGRKGL